MNRMLYAPRLAACLGMVFLAASCASRSAGDGTWTGAAGNFDFNTGPNWSPPVVPTGIATIPASTPPGTTKVLRFSNSSTSLAGLRMNGELSMTLDPTQGLSLRPEGLTVCCKTMQAAINGGLTGNVTLGDQPGQLTHQVGGSGTINGNISHLGGTLEPGSGPSARVMLVKGDYIQQPRGNLTINLWPEGPASMEVTGNVSLSGLLFVNITPGANLSTPLEILSAPRITANFIAVFPPSVTYKVVRQPNVDKLVIAVSR